MGPASIGSVDLTALSGDLGIEGTLSDVQTPAGADYGPFLFLVFRIRVSDQSNCAGASCSGPYDRAGTATEQDFNSGSADVTMSCVPQGDPGSPPGSDCNVNTTANAVIPGAFTAGKQSVVQLFRVRVNDAQARSVLAQQGVYVP